ncbi:heavy-metal-associated domain-containing protein [Lacinutrix salivirga]
MLHTYTVTGMTCNNCKASVEKHLKALPNITNATVNLDASEVTLEMSQHVKTKALQEALPEKYTLSEKEEKNVFSSVEPEEEKTVMQQLFPLFLILFFITGASVLLNYKPWDFNGFMFDYMGLFYVVFSFFKFLDLKGFPESFKMYDPLAKAIPAYGFVYPFIELALGLLFLMRIQIPLALIVTLIILGITTYGVTKTLLDKKAIQCACLGTALKLPMTKATFIENSIMIVMAVIMLINTYN